MPLTGRRFTDTFGARHGAASRDRGEISTGDVTQPTTDNTTVAAFMQACTTTVGAGVAVKPGGGDGRPLASRAPSA